MTGLKQLSAIYLVAASAFAVTIVLDRHPALDHAVHAAAAGLHDHVLQPGWNFAVVEADLVYGSVSGPEKTVPARKLELARVEPAPRKPEATAPPALRPQIVPPEAPRSQVTIPVKPRQVAQAAPRPASRVTLNLAPPETVPPKTVTPKPAPPVAAPELARVEQHLRDNLTDALYAHFDLFLYVSKAAKGPVAQRMYVFAKNGSGGFALRYDWPASTGREKVEYDKAGGKSLTVTPAGYYELDPKRMYRHYRSMHWGQKMPYAMFFNWEQNGYQTGLAIHAAHGEDIARLGQRASAGCIHLSPEAARTLFDLIRKDYKGEVPRFAYDRRTETVSNHGELMRGAQGKLRFYKGYKVLVFIENFGGGADTVAALM